MTMLLNRLVELLGSQVVGIRGPLDGAVGGIAFDSRRVVPGDLFVPWPGGHRHGDGHRYIPEALQAGAVGVVLQQGAAGELPGADSGAACITVKDSRLALALLADAFYGHPSRSLRIIGVTGTNGKSTTAYLIHQLLGAAGISSGLVGTVTNIAGGRELPGSLTTPQAPVLQNWLARMGARGDTHGVVEVSSHALHQNRVAGCRFTAAVFTNLSRDHLDYHGGMDDYAAAKARLFSYVRYDEGVNRPYNVINADDAAGALMARASGAHIIWYGLEGRPGVRPAVQGTGVEVSPEGTAFTLKAGGMTRRVRTPLLGQFNVYNTLAAVAVALEEGFPPGGLGEALAALKPAPGRFQRINRGQPFAVIVDYAHTPDSLEKVLTAARGLIDGRLIIVFGAGGDRDVEKRPLMGAAAGRLADAVITTADNPRSEDPEAISAQIEEGLRPWAGRLAYYEKITDRREAIFAAVGMARPGDGVIIAGRGHETMQIFQHGPVPFDDREVAGEAVDASMGSG